MNILKYKLLYKIYNTYIADIYVQNFIYTYVCVCVHVCVCIPQIKLYFGFFLNTDANLTWTHRALNHPLQSALSLNWTRFKNGWNW